MHHFRESCSLFQADFSTLRLSVALLYDPFALSLKFKETVVNLFVNTLTNSSYSFFRNWARQLYQLLPLCRQLLNA